MAIANVSSSAERQKLHDLNDAYGHTLIEDAPDVRVARRLRLELARDRALGLPFDEIFDDEVDYVLRLYRTSPQNRAQWRAVFSAHRGIWRQAYERSVPSVSSLNIDLIAA